MTQNVGGIDRALRIVAGLVFIILAATGVLGSWAWLGVIVLATGVVGICMPYTLFGFSTCAIKTDAETPAEQ
jgi:hypothetical protein